MDNIIEYDLTTINHFEIVDGNLDLPNNKTLTSLGNVKKVTGGLYLNNSNIKDLGDLTTVGRNLWLGNTPISKTHSEEQIRQQINVDGDIYL